MDDQLDNPYESPKSASVAPSGRMPWSVVAAVTCVGLLALALLIFSTFAWALMDYYPVVQVLLTATLLTVFVALATGKRVGWWVGRFVLLSLAVVSPPAVATLASAASSFATTSTSTDPLSGDPIIIQRTTVVGTRGLRDTLAIAFAATPWIGFFALGRRSARRHFNLICVNCQSRHLKGADFLYHRVACNDCGHTW